MISSLRISSQGSQHSAPFIQEHIQIPDVGGSVPSSQQAGQQTI